ncbi:zona pellucida sperm-binding protein 3-like [Sinocyclocheilus grahami]|uniref:zona pellucida sperm-binding protein 3-like n=1 Tax=Sinocyclocheilus grahami TaxID=75366 RepID=UPI0007AC5487|nr:PREDICTED: zona pellucida sperm-binding protein 3-like [Sinocyclocheilus grahami]
MQGSVANVTFISDDWMFERPSNQYFLGQFLKLEASVKQYNHVPLRIFVDGCVATAAPDVNTTSPRYSFIENHGCLVDAKLTGSTSSFMRRIQSDKLQFQLEAFRFQQDDSGLVYITCALKAVMASTPTCPENKACSFINGWTSVDDNDQVCMCCDSMCGLGRKGLALSDSGNLKASFRPPRPAMRPAGVDARKLQEPGSSQSKQLMQAPMAPLTWHFPVMPEEPQQPDVPFEPHVPIAPQSVAAQCGENFVHVEVKKDFFGTVLDATCVMSLLLESRRSKNCE